MFSVLRFISLLLIVIAFMFMGADLISSLESINKGGQITVRSIEQVWSLVDKAGVDSFKAWLEHTLPHPVSDWIEAALHVWAWALTGVLGVIMAFLFGRRSSDA